MSPIPPFSPKSTTGPIDRTPCPHCGKPMDLRSIKEQFRAFETGMLVSCDVCRRVVKVTAVQQVTIVKLVQHAGVRGDGHFGGKPMT